METGTIRTTLAESQDALLARRFQALRDSLAYSKEQVRTYERIETIVVKQNGEQKARMQNRVYYGADGALQKVPITAQKQEGRKRRGIRGKIAENKKQELTGYMQAAIDTVKRYVPPEPARLKASAQSGKVSFSPIEPGKRVRLDFRDYLKQGDVVGVEVDVVNSRLLGLAINSYIDNPNDVVTLNGQFRTLSDGASYPAQVVLNAPAKSITVELANTGYRKQ